MRLPIAASSTPTRRLAIGCLLTAMLTMLSPAAPASAWTEGPCAEDAGITVVVDFRGFRDEVVVRCAPAPVESGYDALTRAGFSWTPVRRQPGFLCRIEGLPADDSCMVEPPADAYWAYWRAEHGGSWTYSQYGPATTTPPPGPVEGWAFSTGDREPPRQDPPRAAAPAPPSPTPTPATTPTPTSTGTTPPPASPDAADAPDGSTEASAPTRSDRAGTPSPTPTPTPTPTDTDDPAPIESETESDATAHVATRATRRPDASDTTSPARASTPSSEPATAAAPRSGGPPVGTLAGVALLLAVGGGAVVVDRRRRRP